jgi:hypothetical protein
MYSTFEPRPEHQGPALKPNFTGAPEHLGFDKAGKALYGLGVDLTNSLNNLAPEANHTWSAANLFSGINPEPLEALSEARDALATAQAALDLVLKVLQAVEALANLAANVFAIIVGQIITILRTIAQLFNPKATANLLFIPPKIGKINNKNLLKPIDKTKDPFTLQLAKKSEAAKESVIDLINSTSSFLPAAMQDQTKKIAAVTSGFTGSSYLLNTLKAKLEDKTDLCRPCVGPTSHWAGAGIFLGTNSINKLLDAWSRLNSIFNSDLAYRRPAAPGLPPKPVVKDHKVTEASALKCASNASSTQIGPVQKSVVVAPLFPTSGIYGSIEYTFEYRLVLISDDYLNLKSSSADVPKPDVDSGSRLFRKITSYLSLQKYIDPSKLNSLFDLEDFSVLMESKYESTLGIPILTGQEGRATGIPPKILEGSGGYVLLATTDVYSFGATATPSYLARVSDPVYAHFAGSSSEDLIPKYLAYSLPSNKKDFFSSSGKSPKWIGANAVMHLFPAAIKEILNFLDLLETYLKTLIAEALAWLTRVIAELKSFINFLARILTTLDRLISLIQDLLSLTTSLGASVMTFSGNGDSTELVKMFTDYLSVDSSVPSSFSSITTDIPAREPITITAEDLVDGNDGTSPGTLAEVEKQKVAQQREARREKLDKIQKVSGPDGNWKVETMNGAASMVSAGKTSPVFTDDATTCGLVIMAHSSSYGDLILFIEFLKLIFGKQDTAPPEHEGDILRASDLEVTQRNLYPEAAEVSSSSVADPIFTADMKVTTDPKQSPFSFCK